MERESLTGVTAAREQRGRRPLARAWWTAAALFLGVLGAAPSAGALTTVPAANGVGWDICDQTGGCAGYNDTGAIHTGGTAFQDFEWLSVSVFSPDVFVGSAYPAAGFGLTHDGGRRWATTTPVLVGDVEVSRALYAPSGTNELRYIDTFTNTATQRRFVDISGSGTLGSGASTELAASGNRDDSLAQICGRWAVIRHSNDTTSPVGLVFGGLAQRGGSFFQCADFDATSGTGSVRFFLELQPGEAFDIAHFVTVGLAGSAAQLDATIATARRLASAPDFADLGLAQKIALDNWGLPERIATGTGPGAAPHVKVFDVDPATGNASESGGFFAFDPGFAGGVSVAGGGRSLVIGAGPGGGPEVRHFYHDPGSSPIGPGTGFLSAFAYPATFAGGVHVACAPALFEGDLCATVAVAPGPGGAPHVRLFWDDLSGEQVGFLPYDPLFRGGVSVGLGFLTGGRDPDIVTAPGPGGAPLVRVFKQGTAWPTTVSVLSEFFAYDPGLAGGVQVAVGDVLGTGIPQVITGTGAGGAPHIKVFTVDPVTGAAAQVGPGFFAYPPGFIGGASVAVANVDGTGPAELITGTGPGGAPHVRIWRIDPATGAPTEFGPGLFAYDPAFLGGVNVAGGYFR